MRSNFITTVDTNESAKVQAPVVRFVDNHTVSSTNNGASSCPAEFLSKLSKCVTPSTPANLDCDMTAFFDKIETQYRGILEVLEQLSVFAKVEETVAALDVAIERAQQLNSTDILTARKILVRKLTTSGQGEHTTHKSTNEVVRKLEVLKRIEETESYLRMTRGLCRLKNNDIAVGRFDIDVAINWCEELAQDPVVVRDILNTGIPVAELQQWFPGLQFALAAN
ncbi:MAG: hypothetical protein K2X93_00970 [Candidatus Obscuribacterales bacterium]|nr:hypothetical protein [Candidatus Obscuribacterales bacterium]